MTNESKARRAMKERKALVGSTTTQTFFSKALADLQLEQGQSGRFTDKATLTGAARVPQYPAACGPWNDPVQVPDEPPLGWSVEAQEPVGEPFEIAASFVIPSNDANEVPEGDATPPQHAAPVAGSLSPQATGVSSLLRGRRL